MENSSLRNIAFVLFLFLILHHQVLFVQGRNLKCPLCKECSKSQKNTMSVASYEVHQEGWDCHTCDDEMMSHFMTKNQNEREVMEKTKVTSKPHTKTKGKLQRTLAFHDFIATTESYEWEQEPECETERCWVTMPPQKVQEWE
ncbi:hypothetical protein JHK82_012300 [Glycine max]|nr:hypothetical protein JHK85_012655 [Glycine max]KAG5154331.1 hypothetical protein JHK82_012300 [Glycine max]